ncbi:MAG: hypothetical protein WAU72_09340 [Acidimicrobiia bacterium]
MTSKRPNVPTTRRRISAVIAIAAFAAPSMLTGCSKDDTDQKPNIDPTAQTTPNGPSDIIHNDVRPNQMEKTDKEFNRLTSTVKDLTKQTTFVDQQAKDGFERRLGEVFPGCQRLLDTGSGTTDQIAGLKEAIQNLLDENQTAQSYVVNHMGGAACGVTVAKPTTTTPSITS